MEPPNSRVCTDFMDLVVDDSIALEGNQSFTICVGDSSAWVTILDDDGENSFQSPSDKSYKSFVLT